MSWVPGRLPGAPRVLHRDPASTEEGGGQSRLPGTYVCTSVQQLQTFMGMVNFYRRFIRGAVQILKPLTDALCGGKLATLQWSKEMEAAFQESKRALFSAAELAHPDPSAELMLAEEASGTHVGGVLQQSASLRGAAAAVSSRRSWTRPSRST